MDDTKSDSYDDRKQHDNDKSERGNRRRGGTRFSDADGDGGRDRSRERRNCRIYVSNIPYDYRWQELKDLFRRMVGNVEYVELFKDETGQPRGCGIIEFKDPDHVPKALEVMNRYDINGREIVVKEDHGEKRDQYGRITKDGGGGGHRGGGGGGGDDHKYNRSNRNDNMGFIDNGGANDYDGGQYETYGLSKSFLENLGITGPLHYKVFVANLDYKVDKKKLKEIFKLAGKVQNVELALTKEGTSRGFGIVEYDHPVEAVQAISMFDRQLLYERRMTVRLDRIPEKGENIKLPEGLQGVGMGLGPDGQPLRNVSRNLSTLNKQTMQNNPGQSNMDVMSNPLNQAASLLSAVAGQTTSNVLGGLGASNLTALTTALDSVKNLSVLSNPLLASNLSNLGGLLAAQNVAPPQPSIPESNTLPPPPPQLQSLQSLQNPYPSNNFGGQSDFNSGITTQFGGNKPDIRQPDSFGMNSVFGGGNSGNQIGGRKSDTIIIKNIPLSCTWQTLRDKFRDIGEVRFAEIRGNNIGVVRFFKESDAELAIKLMDGSRMDGRTISVSYF